MRNRKTPITTSATSTEKATEISTTSGMPLAPVAARMSPFSSDMKPTTIETAFRLTTIISMPSSTTESAKARSSRASASASLAIAQHHDLGQRDQRQARQHRQPDADHVLDVAANAELGDDAVQRDRDQDRLERERDQRGHVEMIGVLNISLPGDRQRKHDGLRGEDVEQRIEAGLIEQHEADQHQAAGQQMREVESEASHFSVLDTNSSSAPRKPSIRAAPTKSGTRKTRILAMLVSNAPSATPATASFAR